MCKKTNQIVMLLVALVAVVCGFEPDTTIQAGDLVVPVKTIFVEEQNSKEVTYLDSLGRIVYYSKVGGGSKGGTTTTKGLIFTSDEKVKTSFYDSKSSGPGYVHHTKNSLTGKAWNDKGMITKGYYYYWYRDGGTYSSKSYDVVIEYDSTGIIEVGKSIDSSTIKTFNMDGYYTAGEKTLPVMNIAIDSLYEDTVFVDMAWRVLFYKRHSGGPKGAISHTKGLYLTSDNLVKFAYNDSSNSGPGYVKHTKDTLWGEEWNTKGMVTKGHFFQWYRDGGLFTTTEYDLQLVYDETGVNLIEKIIDSSTIKIFKVDKFYTAGALTLPVMTVTPDSLPEDAECLVDSMGRMLYKKYGKGGPKGSWSIEEKLELNSDNQVELSIYEHSKGSVGKSYIRLDSLNGLSWNDKGMITSGIVHQIIQDNGKTVDTTFTVTITYDESGVNPVKTTVGKETSVVSSSEKAVRPVIQYGYNTLTLTGVANESKVAILDVKGRIFKQTSVKMGETISISTGELSNGVYILQINNRNITFIK